MSRNIKSIDELGNLSQYEIVTSQPIAEMKTMGIILKHKKSGARIVVMSNDDENKVFFVGFKTPPMDSTGAAHIVEHTVLCGSKNFPVKDPFIELEKGSLNTFLNAITYPDKTIYPIASCNEQDFQNLMHVYLDAVFYPNIYYRKEIFEQEGWHYEMENLDDELKINGIVYNEMKGAFSSPEQVLFRLIKKSLFPDTAYGTESGGVPDNIPDLSYEEFLDFHKKYYHPVNSYIYLYGDMDIEEKLAWLDKEYLSEYDQISVDSHIDLQASFDEPKEVVTHYPISADESEEDNTYLSYNAVVGTSVDAKLVMSMKVLEYVLLSAPGAPLKQALLDAKIGQDILSDYDSSIMQPMFSIIAKNSNEQQKQQFNTVLKETLQTIVKNGIDEKALRAAINYFEFKYREADFGQFPKGLMYGIQILESWLYDDTKPFIHMAANGIFAFLKEQIGTDYFEGLIQKYLLENKHVSVVIVKPEIGLTAKVEEEMKKKLADYKATLSQQQLQQIVDNTKALTKYQEQPSTAEELLTIPLLSREDIKKEAQPVYNKIKMVDNTTIVQHDIFTNQIAYLRILFDAKYVPNELVPYVGLLSTVLGYVDTKKHSLLELSNEINIHTGGINTFINTYVKKNDVTNYKPVMAFKIKVLYDEVPVAMELLQEILHESKIEDTKRLLEILMEIKSRMQMKLNSSGHSVAVSRATSYYSQAAMFDELTSGISYYHFIDGLIQTFDSAKEEITEKLKQVKDCLFRKDTVLLSVTADDEGYEVIQPLIKPFLDQLSEQSITTKLGKFDCQRLNEGFKTASKVQYVARTGNYRVDGFAYTGVLRVLKSILSFDYLWNTVRVKNGAYGGMCGFSFDGNGYFTSYRDPKLKETNEIYEQVVDYIANFTVDDRDMTKYIIGTISSVDTPLNPAAKGGRSLAAYLSDMTTMDFQREREQILTATKEDIRALADLVKAILNDNNLCVIGNETKLQENAEMFGTIKSLI
ncbi:insulinase family protein [Anaerosporobacter faecicola]|uniref:insulinase family protein n=1 Tax=Anaerosporobacter faecicola TaxID=2718714 RepID=UPI00143958F9|nr:insulinase family protein [Anaerosporobacter faecicola]